jgi:tRNA 2-thiouridine synthesizing protein A
MADDLDLRGLKCPLPALMARKALASLAPGETVWVLASDPLSVVDVPHMCGEEGHVLIEKAHAGDHYRFLIRRGG